MTRGLGSRLWDSLVKTGGFAVGVLGCGIGYVAWVLKPDAQISMTWFLPLLSLFMVGIFAVIHFAVKVSTENKSLSKENARLRSETADLSQNISLPRILSVVENYEGSGKTVCVLQPSPLFSYDIVVSFYDVNEGYEHLACIGTVINIESNNRRIYVTIDYTVPSQEELVKEIHQRNSQVFQRVRVKPHVPKTFLGGLDYNA